MATSDHRQTEAQPRADEDWIFLQHDGDRVKERVGDAKGKEESLWSAAELPKSAQATEKRTELQPSARDEGSVRSAIWDVFYSPFPAIRGLHLFPGVCEPSLEDENPVRLLRTCLKRIMRVVLRAAVFSCMARFLFWSAAKASVVKQPEMLHLLLILAVMNLGTLLANFATWYSELRASSTEMPYRSRLYRFHLERYQGLTDIVDILTFFGTLMLGISMIGIYADVEATWGTVLLHLREVYTPEFDAIGEIIQEYLAEGYPPTR